MLKLEAPCHVGELSSYDSSTLEKKAPPDATSHHEKHHKEKPSTFSKIPWVSHGPLGKIDPKLEELIRNRQSAEVEYRAGVFTDSKTP